MAAMSVLAAANWVEVTAIATGVLALGAVGVLVAVWQIHTTRKQARLDRTLQLHRDMTTGEGQAAKRRLTAMLWDAGQKQMGSHACFRPRFEELRPRAGSKPAGALAVYPLWISETRGNRPLDDLYYVLGGFARLREALHAGALEDRLARKLFEWEVCWWNALLSRIEHDPTSGRGDTRDVLGLRELGREFGPSLPDGLKERIRINFCRHPPRAFEGFSKQELPRDRLRGCRLAREHSRS